MVKRPLRAESTAAPDRGWGGFHFPFSFTAPQKRHTMASALISSAQNMHFMRFPKRLYRSSKDAVDQDSGAGKRDDSSLVCYFLGAGFVTGPADSFRRESQLGVSAAAFSALMRKTWPVVAFDR